MGGGLGPLGGELSGRLGRVLFYGLHSQGKVGPVRPKISSGGFLVSPQLIRKLN